MKYLLCFLFFLSCDTVEEVYLFNQNDPEYPLAEQLAISECINGNAIFSELDNQAEFDNVNFSVGDIFKVTQDANDEEVVFIKIQAINPTDMTLIYDSSNPDLRKKLTFSESEHGNIVTFLKNASCNKTYAEFFEASGLGSTSQMSFSWEKQTILIPDDEDDDTSPEAYRNVEESLNVNSSYPLFFYYYNGSKTYDYVLNEGDEEKTKASQLTLTEVTDSEECDEDGSDDNTYCQFSTLDTSAFPTCNLLADNDAYLLRDYNTKILSLTGDAACANALLSSMGSI